MRSLIRVLAVLLRLFIKSLLYLEGRHSSKVSTVAVRRLKVFSRLPVVSLFQPNRVTSSFNEGEQSSRVERGLTGVSLLPFCCLCLVAVVDGISTGLGSGLQRSDMTFSLSDFFLSLSLSSFCKMRS